MKNIIIISVLVTFSITGCFVRKESVNVNLKNDEGRFIELSGAYNVRDIGGYETADRRYVKSGLLYRADALGDITEEDINKLTRLYIKTYIDFRSKKEADEKPDIAARSVKNQIHIPISPGNIKDLSEIRVDAAKYMRDMNKSFVTDFQKEFKQFFEIIMNENNLPLLFHCTAGKDRTGFAAAMVLSALGVKRDIIYKDYLLSADYIAPKFKNWENAGELGDLLTVKKEFLKAAFDMIESNYGTVESYLQKELNVDIDKMKEIYTTE